MLTQQHPNFFLNISTSPDPGANPSLWEHRLKQRRPISRNPFEPGSSSYGLRTIDSSASLPTRCSLCEYEDGKLGFSVDVESVKSGSVILTSKNNSDQEWGDQIPGWLNLFYDLAWSATFSSLTSVVALGFACLPISPHLSYLCQINIQIFYNAEFYTDDCIHQETVLFNRARFHTLFTFLQLILFGTLASATRGFDITNYILHSPGSDHLEPYDVDTITPDRYGDERLAEISIHVIMVSISISRILIYLAAAHCYSSNIYEALAIYAEITSKTKCYPLKLFIVPVSLVISSTLFFAAFKTTMGHFGQTPQGAKLKFVLWGVAILVEVVAHIVRFQVDFAEGDGIKLKSHRSITGRLTDITTIILGEASFPFLLAR
ncbi:hypothetical protein FRC10_010963 [Ceratobasidium sp. 414]|nr:hypothetical protein FRC10_010963 [Ceratobasidium sp. 414]